LAPLVRLAFAPRLEGVENVPAEGPYLLVSNHSGLGDAEIAAFVVAWLDRFGTERPHAGMVHPLSFRAWPQGPWLEKLCAIPSTYAAAEAALRAGVPVLVFPGGDHEATRPIWQARHVNFGGHLGFLKIARAARVPIVPMAMRGSHHVAPVLWRSEKVLPLLFVFPRLLGIKRVPLTLAAVAGTALLFALGAVVNVWVTGALAWLWCALPQSRLPWPPACACGLERPSEPTPSLGTTRPPAKRPCFAPTTARSTPLARCSEARLRPLDVRRSRTRCARPSDATARLQAGPRPSAIRQ